MAALKTVHIIQRTQNHESRRNMLARDYKQSKNFNEQYWTKIKSTYTPRLNKILEIYQLVMHLKSTQFQLST